MGSLYKGCTDLRRKTRGGKGRGRGDEYFGWMKRVSRALVDAAALCCSLLLDGAADNVEAAWRGRS